MKRLTLVLFIGLILSSINAYAVDDDMLRMGLNLLTRPMEQYQPYQNNGGGNTQPAPQREPQCRLVLVYDEYLENYIHKTVCY